MTTRTILVAGALALLAGCAANDKLDSAREWQRAECNRIIDNESRLRCLKRVDEDLGRRKEEAAAGQKRR